MNETPALSAAAEAVRSGDERRGALDRASDLLRAWRNQVVSLRVGLLLLGITGAACVAIPALSRISSDDIIAPPYEAPSFEHLFGTDSVGRDVLIRVCVAGRLDLAMAGIAVIAALVIGTLLGVLAGSARSRLIDAALMRLVDAVIAFPFLVLVLVLVTVFGNERGFGPLPPGAPAVIAGVMLGDWAFYARLARGQTLALRKRDFIVAARVLGFSEGRIIVRHLLPGVVSTVATYAITDLTLVMITVASLPFLGIGIQPPTAEWGALMYEGSAALKDAWWIAVFPGALLALTGVGLALIADALVARQSEAQ